MRSLFLKTTKFVATIVIATSVFGPLTALAELGQTPATYDAPAGTNLSNASPNNGFGANSNATVTNNANGGYTVNNNTNSTTGTNSSTDLQCSATSGIAICISGFVYWITVGIGSWFANITAYIFDYAVQLSLNSSAYALDFIAIGWGIVRDVANMSFLFILIFIAFKIMFQAETAGTMRMLVWVVIIALLVNFSFLMTRVVIDGGNIVALQFYNAVAAGSPPISNPGGQGSNGTQVAGTQTADITTTIMNAVNPQNLLGTTFNNYIAQQGSEMYKLIVSSVVYILTGVTLFMLAAVFIFAAIRFMMRVIGLWFVIIAAPAAFVAAIFSGKGGGVKWFSTWLGYLLEFSFYPAVFLFMFYIEVRFMIEMGNASLFNNIFNATTGTDWTAIVQASANVGVRLGFVLATMYLILKASTWMGAAFRTVGTSWVENRLTGLGRGSLRLGAGLATGSLRFATQPIRNGIQSQTNVATRTGVNSTLWRSINRAVGGTNQAKPTQLTVRGALSSQGTKVGTTGNILNRFIRGGQQPNQGQQGGAQANPQPQQGAQQGQQGATQTTQKQSPLAGIQGNVNTSGPATLGRARSVINTSGPATLGTARGTINTSGPATLGTARSAALGKVLDELDKMKTEAKNTAQAGAVSLTLASTPPAITNSAATRNNTQVAPTPTVDTSGIKEEIHGLGRSVRDAVAAAKSGTTMSSKVVINTPASINTTVVQKSSGQTHGPSLDEIKAAMKKVVRKENEHLQESITSHTPDSQPTPPTGPAAPAAARPTPPPSHNDLGDTLPLAA